MRRQVLCMLLLVAGMSGLLSQARSYRGPFHFSRLRARLLQVRAGGEILAWQARFLLVPAVLARELDPQAHDNKYFRGAYSHRPNLNFEHPLPNHLVLPFDNPLYSDASNLYSHGAFSKGPESFFFGWSSAVADEIDLRKFPGYVAEWDADRQELNK